ncbi:MAG TPA: hypothetical protein VGG28_04225 [Kofleriaceae bacterium]
MRIAERVPRPSPRAILGAALALFLIYAWPGFIGWDTREHVLQARSGIYTDGHPPAVAHLVRLAELAVTGPALLLLFQAITLLAGLYMLLSSRLRRRSAAIAAAAIFLFPYISGVTAVIAKDSLMAGPLVIGIALLCDDRPRSRWLALACFAFASLMRWNAFVVTFAPMLLLFRWSPSVTGIRRYAIAVVVWIGVSLAAHGANELMTTQREYLWYWSFAYEDIAGTLANMAPQDDAAMTELLDGMPLRVHDHVYDRLAAIYNPASHYHLMRGPARPFDIAKDQTERDAIAAAWKRVVLAHPAAYFAYRVDSYRLLLGIDRGPSFSNVYIWFTVIAAPETIAELGHDAAPSRLQDALRRASVWISLTPLYYTYLYFGLLLLLLPVVLRFRLEAALALSALAYEVQWFVLAATSDLRYSQWMVLCTLVLVVLVGTRLRRALLRRRGV